MTKKSRIIRKARNRYSNALPRIERWRLCQEIGKVYFESNVSYEKLQIIKEYLQKHGVLEEHNAT